MRRLILAILVLFLYCAPAAAETYYHPVSFSDLKHVVYPGGSVELNWLVKSVPESTDTYSTIVITREANGRTEVVTRLKCPPPPDGTTGWYQMSYTDSPPEKGVYTYSIVAGQYSTSCQVDTRNAGESEGGEGSGGRKGSDVQRQLFTPAQWDTIMWWYGILTSISGGFLVMIVVRSGYKYMVSGLNPGVRASFAEEVQRCILAMVLVVLAPVLIKVLIAINDGFVSLFASIVKQAAANAQLAQPEQLDKAGMFEQVLALPFQAILDIIQKIFGLAPIEQLIFNSDDLNLIAGAGAIKTGNVFADVLLNLSLAAFTVYFNAVYTIRHWVVTAALVSTPLIAWIWVLTSERQVIEIWAAEIFQTIFLQTAHALTLGIFLSVLCGAAGGGIDASWLSGGLKDIAVWFASFGGAVCVMVIVFMGYRFMTARNEKEAAQAREGLVKAIAGLIILGLALTIAGFLVYLFNGRWY